jgi:hypothetical protein
MAAGISERSMAGVPSRRILVIECVRRRTVREHRERRRALAGAEIAGAASAASANARKELDPHSRRSPPA